MVHHIDTIDWTWAEPVGMGGYAVVYRVAPGVVAKVGRIEPEEAAAQRHFARQELALPVLDYRTGWPAPERIDRELCPRHGLRQEILPEGYPCTCGLLEHDVLLMPETDAAPVDPISIDCQAFVMGFSRDCEAQFGHLWDARPANVARYRGQLVALDFGEES